MPPSLALETLKEARQHAPKLRENVRVASVRQEASGAARKMKAVPRFQAFLLTLAQQ